MSLNALRYVDPGYANHGHDRQSAAPKRQSEASMSSHHVPPRHPAKYAPLILRKTEKDHRAFHLLFGVPESLTQCVRVLVRDWWSDPDAPPQKQMSGKRKVVPIRGTSYKPFKLRKAVYLHRAYHQLFRNAGTLQQCIEILQKEWWTEPALQGGKTQ